MATLLTIFIILRCQLVSFFCQWRTDGHPLLDIQHFVSENLFSITTKDHYNDTRNDDYNHTSVRYQKENAHASLPTLTTFSSFLHTTTLLNKNICHVYGHINIPGVKILADDVVNISIQNPSVLHFFTEINSDKLSYQISSSKYNNNSSKRDPKNYRHFQNSILQKIK